MAAKQLRAVREDLHDVILNEEPVDESAAQHFVADRVLHHGAVAFIDESMLVDPLAIGALELGIDESIRWFPG